MWPQHSPPPGWRPLFNDLTAPCMDWVSHSKHPSDSAGDFLGCPDLSEWGVVQAWWAGRVACSQSFPMEADLWGIVASLFLTSCGCESLLPVKSSATCI